MCHTIEKVFNMAVSTFARRTPATEVNKSSVNQLVEATNRITAEDMGLHKSPTLKASVSPVHTLDEPEAQAPVTYIPVAENNDVSVGVFIIKEGEGIPLHDHPNMHGILRCLVGKLRITSMTRTEGGPGEMTSRMRSSRQMIQKFSRGELLLVEQARTIYLTPESQTCAMVEPDSNNIHRIESVDGPAAFLDILAPPYNIYPEENPHDNQERDCHYFSEVAEVPKVNPPEGSGKPRKWVVMKDPPASFYCDTEPYMGQKINSPLLGNYSGP